MGRIKLSLNIVFFKIISFLNTQTLRKRLPKILKQKNRQYVSTASLVGEYFYSAGFGLGFIFRLSAG